MTSTNNLVDTNLVSVTNSYFAPVKMKSTTPSNFRLKRKANGELVLMGGFNWYKGFESGVDWEELETEIEE